MIIYIYNIYIYIYIYIHIQIELGLATPKWGIMAVAGKSPNSMEV